MFKKITMNGHSGKSVAEVFEDFVISGIVIGDTIREACTDVDVDNPKLGKYILQAVYK
jgi:hypothetical protein